MVIEEKEIRMYASGYRLTYAICFEEREHLRKGFYFTRVPRVDLATVPQ